MTTTVESLAEEIRDLITTEDDIEAIAMQLAQRIEKIRPSVVLSEVDGVVVGWDTCGSCLRHIRTCGCPTGPIRPHYIDAWVANHPGYQPGAATSQVAEPSVSTAVDTAAAVVPINRRKTNGPTCSGCGQPVTEEIADRNDDNTWTCFACQTGSA